MELPKIPSIDESLPKIPESEESLPKMHYRVRPEFIPYTDKFGMIQIESDGTQGTVSDNGNLWTAFYVLGLKLKGLMTIDDENCLQQIYLNNFIQPGLLTRYPGCKDFEAQDDLCGILMADSLIASGKSGFSGAIAEYGLDHNPKIVDPREPNLAIQKQNDLLFGILSFITLDNITWNYNTVSPDSFSIYSWMGRRVELVAAIKMSAGLKCGIIEWCYWAAVMIKNIVSKPKVEDSVADILHYCNAISCAEYGPVTKRICQAFRRSVKKKFGDVGKMFGWSNQQVNHPLVKFLEGVY